MFGWFRSNDELLKVQSAVDVVTTELEFQRAPRRMGRLSEARGTLAGQQGWLAVTESGDGFEVELHLYLRPNLGVGLYVGRREITSAGSRDVFPTGDEPFDARFLVCGGSHEAIVKVLDLEARLGLMELAELGEVRASDAMIALTFETQELDGQVLVRALQREAEVARSMIEGLVLEG